MHSFASAQRQTAGRQADRAVTPALTHGTPASAALGTLAETLNSSPRSIQLKSLADDVNDDDDDDAETLTQRRPAEGTSHSAAPVQPPRADSQAVSLNTIDTGVTVAQRVSDFSRAFIEKILLPKLIEKIPGAKKTFTSTAQSYLKVDDSNAPDFAVAVEFIQAVAAQIPTAQYAAAIEAFRESTLAVDDEMEAAPEGVPAVNTELQDRIGEFETAATVIDIRRYVEAEKTGFDKRGKKPKTYEDILLSSGSALLLNPSSGAHYLTERDKELMPLSHGPQVKASLYHRSAKHQMFSGINATEKAQILEDMVVKVQGLRGSGGSGAEAHAGLYPNAATFLANRAPGGKNIPAPSNLAVEKETTPGTGAVYDQTLLYKLALSEKVADLAGELTYLTVGVYNEYPLVMVHFNLSQFMKTYTKKQVRKPSDGTKKAFTSFLMNYYTGLVNFYAQGAGLGITMVERSSFGFNTPSIAETGESFRINMGLMPPVYAHVQAQALQRLDEELKAAAASKIARDPDKHKLGTNSAYFDVAPPKESGAKRSRKEMKTGTMLKPHDVDSKRDEINEIDDWLNFALYPIEKKGKTAIANATRTRASLDFVNARSFNTLVQTGETSSTLGPILAELFGHMAVKGKTLSTKVPSKKVRYEGRVPRLSQAFAPDEPLEQQHAALLGLIAQQLTALAQTVTDKGLANQLVNIVPLLTPNNPHLETTLDLVNELLLVHALHETEGADVAPGYGSESDEEEQADELKPDKRLLAGKKIITHNGMRAAISAIGSIPKFIYPNEEQLNLHIIGAYYEMDDALKQSNVAARKVADVQPAHALVTDINACVTDADPSDFDSILDNSAYPVWIIDTTSATQRQMSELVDKFRSSGAKFLYLVSSGFKQEQFGADRNQYGTIRVFTDRGRRVKSARGQENALDSILAATKLTDKPLAASAHIYRRVMKKVGAVPRNVNIFSGAKGESPQKARKMDQSLLLKALLSVVGEEVKKRAMQSSSTETNQQGSDEESDAENEIDIDEDVGRNEDFDAEDYDSLGEMDIDLATVMNSLITSRLYADFLEALKQAPQEEIVLNPLADNTTRPQDYIFTEEHEPEVKEQRSAPRDWFHVILNQGGGDCVLHALSGVDLSFAAVVELRQQIAAAAEQTLGETLSGNLVNQALVESHVEDADELLEGRHTVPRSVVQAMMRVPGMYAGELEIRAYCAAKNLPAVYLVTQTGEIREIRSNGADTLATVAEMGEYAFKQQVLALLQQNFTVLYKKPDHWEKIVGVN